MNLDSMISMKSKGIVYNIIINYYFKGQAKENINFTRKRIPAVCRRSIVQLKIG